MASTTPFTPPPPISPPAINLPESSSIDVERQSSPISREDTPLLTTPDDDGDASQAWSPPLGFVPIQLAIMTNVFLYGFDGTITAATYAVISSEFDAANSASWLTTSYLVTATAFQPLYGRVSDIFGRRACFFVSTVVFALGCLGCGVASTVFTLNCMRAITGIGGAGLMTMGMFDYLLFNHLFFILVVCVYTCILIAHLSHHYQLRHDTLSQARNVSSHAKRRRRLRRHLRSLLWRYHRRLHRLALVLPPPGALFGLCLFRGVLRAQEPASGNHRRRRIRCFVEESGLLGRLVACHCCLDTAAWLEPWRE